MSAPNSCFVSVVFRKSSTALLLLSAGVLLTGCGIGPAATLGSSNTITIHGLVHGGQAPVSQSSIQLYTVGSNGSASKPMLSKTVTSAADGTFDIAGDYACGSDSDQVYLTATGGDPGLNPAASNPALIMMAAFGSCGNLSNTSFIEINEVTTVAAAWALSPFIVSATNIGTSTTNANGLASGFLNAHLLADTSTGTAAVLPANLTVETDKLYALADAIASCVNSDGTTGCTKLFAAATPPNGTAPTDTLTAALNIVRNPGNNVGDVFGAINAQAPFSTALPSAPYDWTMSLTVTGGGINSPTGLAIDSKNNVWVASYTGLVSAFTAQGTPFNSAGYGSGILSEVYGLTIDPNDNIWVTNEEEPSHSGTRGSVTAFLGSSSNSVGSLLNNTQYYSDASIDYPESIASDPNGDILIGNYAGSTATIYSDNGTLLETNYGQGSASLPQAIAPDLVHGMWLANTSSGSITHVSSTGATFAVDGLVQANGLATDKYGNIWVTDYYNVNLLGEVNELTSDGVTQADIISSGGLTYDDVFGNPTSAGPSGIAIDANQTVWVANYHGASIAELQGNGASVSTITAVSPSQGFGLDASLLLPYAIAPDAGGNLWVSNFGAQDSGTSTITMFFGLAAPTSTPTHPVPVAP